MAGIVGVEYDDVRHNSGSVSVSVGVSIGILGGTFDPIHNGHIQIAKVVLDALHLSQIKFIPCYHPPHREQPIASPTDRLAMVKLAIAPYLNFSVDEMEIHRKGISYSVDTLTQLRKKMPNESFCFILGADVFAQLHLWHEWKKIIDLTHLIIVGRPNISHDLNSEIQALLNKNQTCDQHDLEKNLAGKIYYLDNKFIDISATSIRSAIQSGEKNITGLDKRVEEYIFEKGLYAQNRQR